MTHIGQKGTTGQLTAGLVNVGRNGHWARAARGVIDANTKHIHFASL